MAESETGIPSPERLPTRAEMVALHTRMAVSGEALNPETKLEDIKEENLGNLEQTIKAAANSSTRERNAYWERKWQEMASSDSSLASLEEAQKLEEQKKIWRRLMVERFKAENNQPLVAKLKAKKTIGGINFEEEFSEETAAQIYKRYFEGQKQGDQEEVLVIKDGQQEKLVIPSNLNQFIDDIIEAYQGNLEAIEQDLEAIVWCAGIFGNQMANKVIFEIIRTKLILANETKKQELIQQANANDRRNTLTKTEKDFCQWLWEGTKMERKKTSLSSPSSAPAEELQVAASPERPTAEKSQETSAPVGEEDINTLMRQLNVDPSRRDEAFAKLTDPQKRAVAKALLERAGGDIQQVPEWARPYLSSKSSAAEQNDEESNNSQLPPWLLEIKKNIGERATLWGHGLVNQEVVERILKNGLWAKGEILQSTAIPLEIKPELISLLQNWPHLNAPYVVLISVPHIPEEIREKYEISPSKWVNEIIFCHFIPEDQRVGEEMNDFPYAVPPELIIGYYKKSGEFVPNPSFNLEAGLQKMIAKISAS
jgi:hypothetical protein